MGGEIAIQAALYIATALLSNLIANNAAAALLFPVVLSVSKKQNVRLDLLAFLLMFGASSAFMTPYGYQTNMMVQDVGGYKPLDYARFGAPFQVRPRSGVPLWHSSRARLSAAVVAVRSHALCCTSIMDHGVQVWQAIVTIAILAVHDYWYISWIVVGGIALLVFLPHLMTGVPTIFKFKRHAKPSAPSATQLGNIV